MRDYDAMAARVAKLELENQWYRSLELSRDVPNIGGETAGKLGALWDELVVLREKLEAVEALCAAQDKRSASLGDYISTKSVRDAMAPDEDAPR